MAFYDGVTSDVPVQEGTFAYSYMASGTIKKGQLVYPTSYGSLQVAAINAADKTNVLGPAVYESTGGTTSAPKWIAVLGPGNIARCMASGTITAGAVVSATMYGEVYSDEKGNYAVGYALENKTNHQEIKVLLI